MIELVEGEVLLVAPGRLVVKVGGLGLCVEVPSAVSSAARRGDVLSLYAHLSVGEEGFRLFGFSSREERDLFRMLISVKGVGPRQALSLLSHLGYEALLEALCSKNASLLSSVPGVGPKGARKLCVELEDKLAKLAPVRLKAYELPFDPEEALEGLISLGFKRKEAISLLEVALGKVTPDEARSVEGLIRAALKEAASRQT